MEEICTLLTKFVGVVAYPIQIRMTWSRQKQNSSYLSAYLAVHIGKV